MSHSAFGFSPSLPTERSHHEAALNNGVLIVRGTAGKDVITLTKVADRLKINAVLNGRRTTQFHDFADVKGIKLLGLGGSDLLTNQTRISSMIDGGTGNDTLRGGLANDVLLGGNGNDRIFARAGNDQLRGGRGNDRLIAEGGADRIFGDAGSDVLFGGAGNDIGVGGQENDIVYGGDGNDELFGNEGNDQLIGETGDDILKGDDGSDLLRGNHGSDRLFGGDANDRLYGDNGNDLIYGGDADDSGEGGLGNDQLFGDAGRDRLAGQSGADLVRGGAGNDWLEADDLDTYDSYVDRVIGDEGNDTLLGTRGDSLQGGGSSGDQERHRYFVEITSPLDDGKTASGQLSVTEAIRLANDDDIIHFGKLTAASSKVISLGNVQLSIHEDLTFRGIGSSGRLTFDGTGGSSRFMKVVAGASVKLENLQIRNFNAAGEGDFFSDVGKGGGIYVEEGRIVLSHVTARGNQAINGGVLFLNGPSTSAVVIDSDLLGNSASSLGGAIRNFHGELSVVRSTLDDNAATWGGAIYNEGEAAIVASTLSNNYAVVEGGGVSTNSGFLTVLNTTISKNKANDTGGGLFASLDQYSKLVVTHSTIAFNHGGGMAVWGDNEGIINNSIVFGNLSGGGRLDFHVGTGINEFSSSGNLIGSSTNTNFLNGVGGNLVGIFDAGLSSVLADNGGPAKTHKLLSNSDAIDAGNNAKARDLYGATLQTDQTGKSRKVGSRVDIGAYEFRA
jgi:hypothetical protein